MLGLSPWISLAAVLLAALIARLSPPFDWTVVERALNDRRTPAIIGVLSGLLLLWVWGSLAQSPVIHDESAYLLQAQLFAALHWTGGGRPLPAFFEQAHILIDGVLASKYPPGNSLLLTFGVLLGLPGLPVIVMNAGASALMFALARRAAGGVVALLTWIVWQSSFPMVYYRASYMSESASALAWLLAWWGIARWHDDTAATPKTGRKWLIVAAGAVAWCAITRPLTGVALALVAGCVVLRQCQKRRVWRDLVPAASVAAAILAILPLWSWRTTGNAFLTPLTSYTKTYLPFDKPGFGAGPGDLPSNRLPLDQARIEGVFYRIHAEHTVSALPRIAWQRLTMIDRDEWYEWRGGLRVFALVGLLALSLEGWIGLAAFALQFLLYLSYAHPAFWTLYYVECMPMLAFVTALGIARCFALLDNRRRVNAAVLVATVGIVIAAVIARQVKSAVRDDHAFYDGFAQLVRQIPDARAIVFVRYGPKHLDGLSYIRNVPDLTRARVWTVYDRGAENEKLLAIAPERAAYLFDEQGWELHPLQRHPSPSIATVARDSLRAPPGARRLR
ncbi:MAG TPA: hypothetical protein VJO33_05590 [Gemmatimonadaceae bacterium]|nr:hypothetical protein [Gemmatimonadaceae bacterium]